MLKPYALSAWYASRKRQACLVPGVLSSVGEAGESEGLGGGGYAQPGVFAFG